MAKIVKVFKSGSCRSGSDTDGKIIHAIENNELSALCGERPKGRSVGWSSAYSKDITCKKCMELSKDLEVLDEEFIGVNF